MKRFRQISSGVLTVLLLFSSIVYADTWTKSKNLSINAGDSEHPVIAVDGSNIYVVWQDDTPGRSQLYFKRSADGGATWSANKSLTNSAIGTMNPAIAVDASNIYVVWTEYEIYFKRSIDGGNTWSKDKRLTFTNTGTHDFPAIAVNGSSIYVVWYDYTAGDGIYFKRSVDGGVNWSPNKRLIATPESDSKIPAIAVNGSNIYVVWNDFIWPHRRIYFKRSVDGGVNWSPNKMLANEGLCFSPAIAVVGSNIYVVWGNEIYFKRSVDGGVNWSPNKLLSDENYPSSPAIAVNGSNIYVVWQNEPPNQNDDEIYFKRSVDGGVNWSVGKTLSNNAGDSRSPAIAVDGSNIYVVWKDDTTTHFFIDEIYFKKGVMD
jgi:hypothetical protein